ncbi:tetratricopeptide repeat protein [Lutibacter sp. Hel_I_33_5]|uniref:tetratricopeptide repeat-containing sensor histidine kinase n=1 Tax=Lutibacter sp. Hel_I_33_5 TaxID=1566289 RepID=UPI0011A0B2CE|nr:histidine kinase [Lutibacter sp. Hel_I_33_5]TVZ56777.1 tetratricopeptide repeat protein [Lutibacter sp. Hel_I_33_5]
MLKKSHIVLIFLFCGIQALFSQENISSKRGIEFSLKVAVVDKNTNEAIKNAEVYVNGVSYRFSIIKDKYIVKARVDDELSVTHPDFETVYYTINSNEEIKILVEGFADQKRSKYGSKKAVLKSNAHYQNLDSAKYFKKKDIDKSISFIEKNLKTKQSRKRNAATYKTLADIYLYWNQYDLASNNYKLSLQINDNASTKIDLANALFLQKKYAESEKINQSIIDEKLSNFEKIKAFEGLGDVQFALKKYNGAKINYNEALKIAKKNLVTPKITDINSKIAEVYAAEGNILKANLQFQNSLDLAAKENVKRSLIEEEKVADFLNESNLYDDEIKLRKESLKKATAENIEKKDKGVEVITSQKINYKIGNAYAQKEDYDEAIPFLEKSIKDANDNKDIIIQKDATRKLSEVYASVGDYNKALKSYQDYVELVDKSYIKKEQEINQAKHFSKKIADNQNRISSLEKDKELAQSKISLAIIDQKLSEESNKRQRQIIYFLIAGILLLTLLAYFMFRNNKQQKIANNLLALKSMRSQMNPHFIFNALNSVNSFIAVNDERNANRYLSEFSVLMRSVLENSDEDFIPLSKEIELLELYVKLEHNRFKDKFEYSISVNEDIDLDQFSIPPMLLQPYIENAIWHGLRYKEEKGNLEISINQQDEELLSIEVIDNGIGRKKSQELKTKNQLKQKSKGMSTIKNRINILNDMYKDRVTVTISDVFDNGEGTKVALLLKKK